MYILETFDEYISNSDNIGELPGILNIEYLPIDYYDFFDDDETDDINGKTDVDYPDRLPVASKRKRKTVFNISPE